MARLLATICILGFLASVSSKKSVLEVVIKGLRPRIFVNASLGLDLDFDRTGHQCYADGSLKSAKLFNDSQSNRMTFTPNRRSQASALNDALHQQLKMAVVLVVGGHSNSYYDYGPGGSVNGLLAVWDSWLEYFFSPSSNTSSLILLFDHRDFKRQNISKTRAEYLDSILVKNMGAELVDCAHVRLSHHHSAKSSSAAGRFKRTTTPLGCSAELMLDQQYRVYFVDIPSSNYSRTFQPESKNSKNKKNSGTAEAAAVPVDYSQQRPLIIFAALQSFPPPSWAANEDEEELFKNWKPGRLNRRYPTNYGYTKLTNWYAFHMLQLRLLDFFDYASKLDNDVSFVAPFPTPNLPLRLAQQGAVMLMTTRAWYYDDPRIAQGVHGCLLAYLQQQAAYCRLPGNAKTLTLPASSKPDVSLRAGGDNDSTFFETNFNATFRAHFLVYWLGLYTAPETVHMARHWNDWHPRGMWDYRWGDQQWWPRPIAVLGTGHLDTEILHAVEFDSDDERFVVHKRWPHYHTVSKAQYYDPVNGTTKELRLARYKEAAKPYEGK